ncbi:MAG TPA: acetyl-coenzyme A synthetase N-terminal domain-containing protein, partial [Thermoanaerobaculia bacterium]|nr:acetyl-coenzyme A synthetase N-terminal domain-containing protein [Thermoanaerobaculia bacterium]
MSDTSSDLASLLLEDRRFPPPDAFIATANARDPGVHARAAADPEGFWASFARELDWMKPF